MSTFLNFIAGMDLDDTRAIAKREEQQVHEDEQMRIQTEKDVAEFLAEEKAGRTYSMMDASGTVGKWMVGGMALLALSGMFNSCVNQARAAEEPPAATAVQQVQKQDLQVPTHNVMVKINC